MYCVVLNIEEDIITKTEHFCNFDAEKNLYVYIKHEIRSKIKKTAVKKGAFITRLHPSQKKLECFIFQGKKLSSFFHQISKKC